MANITIEIPDELLRRWQAEGEDPDRILRTAAAMTLCSRGDLSTSQAARLAGMSYGTFVAEAARQKIELYPVDLEEFQEEITRGFTLGRQRLPSHPVGGGGQT